MTAKIKEIRKVSPGAFKHISDPKELNVIDIAPSSIPEILHEGFKKAVRNENRVERFFYPPDDPAFHLEIPQPRK